MGRGKNYQSITKNLTITLTGESGTTCSYNLYFKDTSSNGSYIYARTGEWLDFYLFLYKNDTLVISNIDYALVAQTSAGVAKITSMFGGSTPPLHQAKPTITIPSGSTSVTDSWTLRWNFYNQYYDQSALAGKTFKGELYVDDVTCA